MIIRKEDRQMDEHQLPGAEPDPDRGAGTAQGTGGPIVDSAADDDFDEWAAWLDREVAAGRDPAPRERDSAAEGISISLGDAVDFDPELLAAMCGPQSLGGEGLGTQFAEDAAADVLSPSPVLAALTESAVAEVTRLTDDQLIGVLRAARRQENREAWKKALVIAEFARRRAAEFKAAEARGVPVHCRPGQFPGEELVIELLVGPVQASHAIDDATDLATRLPDTMAGMAAGLIDEARAGVIALHTRSLSAADAAVADGILAALAPTLRLDQLARKASSLEMKLDPEAVRARREHARRTRQRVEVRREESGNASVAGREMDTGDALASKAHIHALALRLRRAGMPGNLDQLRLLVFADLTVGRDPLDRLDPPDSQPGPEGRAYEDPSVPSPASEAPHPETAPGGKSTGTLDYQDDDSADDPDTPLPEARPPDPVPATINLVVHAGTLFGWDTTPTEAGGWGLLDGDETRSIVAAASQHSATRWCVTVIGRDGTALAHGCSPGQHPWIPSVQGIHHGTSPPDRASPRTPTFTQAAHLDDFLRRLNVALAPIAKGGCDHATAEPRYTPSRRLTHLVRARTATCDAPGCTAQAVHADLDHTTPYPDGATDQCNLGPKCRRHHKAKQAPGWKVEQPEPGVIRWTLPSGRAHTTWPTVYDDQLSPCRTAV
jgi:uncharacterized protein DUF222